MKLTGTGNDFEQFAVGLNLASLPEAAQFVAREKELSNMHELLHGHINRTRVVLHGLGGIGKTQLAIEYIRRYLPRTSLLASIDLDNLDQVVHTVKAWLDLQHNTHWLMVYNNYDNPKTPSNLDCSAFDIRQLIPQSDQGSIIITTRSSQVSQRHGIHVQKLLDVKEGLEILLNTSGRKDNAKGISFTI
jgi:hypothetical protein